jgi:hypothetical protein
VGCVHAITATHEIFGLPFKLKHGNRWVAVRQLLFFSFFSFFFSFPTSRFEPSWPKLNYVMSFWFCIRFDFHSFNCYLSCIESYFYLFFVPFHPLVFSFIFFSCQIWSLFFLFFFLIIFLIEFVFQFHHWIFNFIFLCQIQS